MSFVLVAVLAFSFLVSPFGFSLTANAQEIMTEERISSLLDELTENLALSMVVDDDLTIKECEAKITKIEQQLKTLGVTIAVNAHGAAVVDSVPSTYSEQKTETISADCYCENCG